MKCHEVIDQFSLYSYGEVSGEAEERIESHLAACAECARAFAKHRAFFGILNGREASAGVNESALLSQCRMDFRRQLAVEIPPPSGSWLSRLLNLAQFHIPMRIPAGAMALFALGWFAARYTPAKFGGIEAGLGQPMFSNVQSVQSGGPGRVQIAVDDVQRRVVTGSLDEPRIQQLLLDAVREESNPGVRVESIGILRNSADSEQVRGALIDALSHDPNAGVRLKALEGLKQYAGDPAVRQTLANVLLRDDNPGVRVQAIDLLTTHHDDSIVGVLQDVMQKEDDGYIRTRTRDLLEAMKASVGTY
jgi:hypothetical protein